MCQMNSARMSPCILTWVLKEDANVSVDTSTRDAPLSAAERQELVELRRKLHQVQMERDIMAQPG